MWGYLPEEKKKVAESSLLFVAQLGNKPMVAGDTYLRSDPNQDVPSQCEIAYVKQTS